MPDTEWKEICDHVSYRFHGGKLTVRASLENEDVPKVRRGKIYQTFEYESIRPLIDKLPPSEGDTNALDVIISAIGHSLLSQAALNALAVKLMPRSGTTPLLAFDIVNESAKATMGVIAHACIHVEVGELARQSHSDDIERFRKILDDDH